MKKKKDKPERKEKGTHMKEYETPELEIITFQNEDLITTSGDGVITDPDDEI